MPIFGVNCWCLYYVSESVMGEHKLLVLTSGSQSSGTLITGLWKNCKYNVHVNY